MRMNVLIMSYNLVKRMENDRNVAGLRKCKILKSQRILINAVNINWFVKVETDCPNNFTIRHLGSYVVTWAIL